MSARPVLALALSLALGCGGNADATSDALRSVRGIVRDAVRGGRLSGVSVRFVSDTLDTADDKTNSEGSYRISVATDTQNGRLEATKSGYAPRVVSVFFDTDDVQVDLDLSPASQAP